MAHDGGDACVYVKESVLRELEQERRRLKWQLSRALQTSDTRAAELETSKAKVKDLLTILEVNKGVADHAVQRSHGRDAQRRAELEALCHQNKWQRQRYIGLALQSMRRRVRSRQQRGAFQLLRQTVLLRSRRREALLKLHGRIRWRMLHRGLEKWKRYCYWHENGITGSVKVYPLPQEQLHASEAARFTTNVHLARAGSTNAKAIADDIWRRWQLLRKVWQKWERFIRRKRRYRDFMGIASKRLLTVAFVAWGARIRSLRQCRVFLRRIIAKTTLRLQQRGFTSFRLRCTEVSAHEWAQVLKAAHIAMEEERKLRAEVQSSAAGELHTAYIREENRQQRFTKLQIQRQEDFKRREIKRRTFLMLRFEVIRTRPRNAIALRFQRLRHHQHTLRKLFTLWKREASRSKLIKTTLAVWSARRIHSVKANCFRLFAQAFQRKRQRRLRLRGLISKIRRAWLLRGWLYLRIRSAIEERNAMAHVELWQLSQQAEENIQRSRKVALKYQITCALFMADQKQAKLLGKVFRGWWIRTTAATSQQRALRRIVTRRRVESLRGAIRRWVHVNENRTIRSHQMNQYQHARRHRAAESAFDSWKRSTHEKLRMRLATHRQRSCFRTWRQWHDLRRQRVQWLQRLLQRSMERWQRWSFQSWKFKLDHFAKVCARKEHAEHELLSRLWRRWTGFIAFRLHKKCQQQQKALSGVRNALHRTILSTALASWQTNWRWSQARERVVIRVFRQSTSRTHLKRYLQTWHRYSALMARRRTTLNRLCLRQSIRRLQSKWHHWIRASLCTSIAMLETSSVKAQQQIDSVIQSGSRTNALRRTIRTWRLVSTEAARQQRRRALFAEKRRYTTLQATLRQWQREITCFPLTKQRRMLRHLLAKFQLYLERSAFRRWERWVHTKTLCERDRISAELFRRSEIRVMALANEIRAERELRLVFASWRTITAHKKKACQNLQIILLKHLHRSLQNSWGTWVFTTRTQRCVVRLMGIITQRLKAAAWHKFKDVYHNLDLKATGARRAGIIWHRLLLRHAWNHWKRTESFLSKHAALAQEKSSSIQSMIAFKETIARRHHRKRFLFHIFMAWKQYTSFTKRLGFHLRNVLGRRVQTSTAYHFQKWRKVVEQQCFLQQILHRVVKRQQARKVRSALDRWRRWNLEAGHRLQLEQTKRAMLHQREISAKRIAAVKFLSWQQPCLEVHFVRWKVHVEQRRRYVIEQRRAITHRHLRRFLQTVWRSWCQFVRQSRHRTHLLKKTLNETRIALLEYGFYRWDRWSCWMQDITGSLIRVVRIRELWQWRRGFSALRYHHQEAIRRQSVMAASAFSAHSARQRDHQTQMMHAVALVLQRKTSVALCDRSFRRWAFYVITKAKTRSVIRLAHARSQKRMERRCFIKWQKHTRQNVVLQQKLRRRQETWQWWRQQRVWSAWVYFTQHSIDVKHSVYDRLIICALRHSLQGAWGRWKAHTRHVNGLLDAQRVAQWEHEVVERDQVLNTLVDSHERLSLRAAQLGQQNNALRQRLACSATRKIHHVLDLAHKAKIALAFEVWKHKLQQVHSLQSSLTSFGLRYQRLALQRWHLTTSESRTADKVKRVKADAAEWAALVAHTCGTQRLKRRTFLTWRTLVRVRRRINRHIAVAQRRREHQFLRYCWTSWKSVLDSRAKQQDAAIALQARRALKTVVQTYWQWRSVHELTGFAKLTAIRTLSQLRRLWKHRLVVHGWNRWKAFTTTEDVAILHSKLILVELERDQAADLYTSSQLLIRAFSSWKVYVRGQRDSREGRARVLAVLSCRRLLHRHFACWKRRPTWNRARLLVLRRMERLLRRHYAALVKFAVWVWLVRVQVDSRALMHVTIQLQVASKHFTPTTDVPARTARALLTDLFLAEHQLSRAKVHSAWRLVNAIVRGVRQRMLQTAFGRLANGATIRFARRLIPAPNARAFVDKLRVVLLRSGFQRWKQQYLALAIQEAEEAQQELLRALHHVTSYRQALDPYAQQH